jgi:hypothetical protein
MLLKLYIQMFVPSLDREPKFNKHASRIHMCSCGQCVSPAPNNSKHALLMTNQPLKYPMSWCMYACLQLLYTLVGALADASTG